MSTIGTSHRRLWCSWRWVLSTHLVPLQVSCHLSPFETTLSGLEAYELNKSWSLNIHVPPGYEASFHWSANMGMSWRNCLTSVYVPYLCWPELQLGYSHLPLLLLWKPEGVIFVPWNAKRFHTCLSMNPLRFCPATVTSAAEACKVNQAPVVYFCIKVFKGMLLPRSKILLIFLPSQPIHLLRFWGQKGQERELNVTNIVYKAFWIFNSCGR